MGLMGHGIIQVTAEAGLSVVGVDPFDEARTAGIRRIQGSLEKMASKAVAKGKKSEEEAAAYVSATMGRISAEASLAAVADCDLIIEAMPEDIDLKNRVFSELQDEIAKAAGSNPILASNTSSLQLSDMTVVKDRQRFLGLHFFNPVQLMGLVEVVKGAETSEDVFDTGMKYVQAIRKTPVACGDTPGFVVNRLLVPYMSQAILMLERGDATIEGIDAAMRLGAGYPMGPILLADYVGLDTCASILRGWTAKYPDEPTFQLPKLLEEMVSRGHLGRKTGRGFYHWDGDKPGAVAYEG